MNITFYTVHPVNTEDKEDALTLEILEAIENDSEVTQRHLATSMGVALGLANSYLKRCVSTGLIKIHQAPANRYLYYLTPKGFAEKSRLTAKYLSGSLKFYRRAGDSCREVFRQCEERGLQKIVLCGYSELAEIAILRAQDCEVEIIGIFDPNSVAESRLGLPVWNRFERVPEHNALVLTTLKQPDEFLVVLRDSVRNSEHIFIPSVLGLRNDMATQ